MSRFCPQRSQSHPAGDATATITRSDLGRSIDAAVTWGTQRLSHDVQQLDNFGRPITDTISLPPDSGNTDTHPSSTTTAYNPMGWKQFVSELGNAAGTTYSGFDPYGRPSLIVAADGSSTSLGYTGARIVTRTQKVWNGTGLEIAATTREDYDGLGRLRQIEDPMWKYFDNPTPPQHQLGVTTRYTYEVGGRLTVVHQRTATGADQERDFIYDGRGFLVKERHPELGYINPQDNKQYNDTTYYKYDARGNVTTATTPTGEIGYEYDEAGRLLKVTSGPRLARFTLKTYQYGTSGSETGKVTQSVAYNYRYPSACTAYGVEEDYTHDSNGRVQQVATSLCEGCSPGQAGTSRGQWTQSYAWDGAGRLTGVTYPTCVPAGSCAPE